MNIFHLDKNPRVCASYHCDKHVVKMILETAQMLSTAYQRHFGPNEKLYKPAYPKHPMTLWVGESKENFLWALDLFKHLLNQYTLRYKKIHASDRIYNVLISLDITYFVSKGFINPPLCMPDIYKCNDYVLSYKNYYINEKKRFAKYTLVETPNFMMA
jgi:hypothetical protein